MPDYSDFLRACIRNKHPVLPRIIAFNRNYVSRLQAHCLSPAGHIFLGSPLDEQASARLLRHRHQLVAADFYTRVHSLIHKPPVSPAQNGWVLNFASIPHRVALLPPTQLQTLAHYCGLVANRAAVATLIDGAAVKELRVLTGEEGHVFALRRSALLPLPKLEAVQEFAARSDKSVAEKVLLCGFSMLAACLYTAPADIFCAVASVLPEPFIEAAQRVFASASAEIEQHAWPLLRTLILKEITPEWENCFS